MTYEEAKFKKLLAFSEPKTIRLDPTNLCNRKCSFCGHPHLSKKKEEFISLDLIEKISKESSTFLKRLIIGFNNEPLLHPKILEIISIFRKDNLNLSICMISNADKIISKNISIYDLFKRGLNLIHVDIYDENSLNYWDKDLKNLKENGISLKDYYKTNYMYSIKGSKDKIILFCKAIDFAKEKVKVRNWHTYGGTIPISHWRNNFSYPLEKQCTDPLKFLNIDSDGNVPICCRDMSKSTSIGNVNNQSIKEIWQSENNKVIQYILKNKKRGLISCCYFCNTISHRVGLYPYVGKIFNSLEIKNLLNKIVNITKQQKYNFEEYKDGN